MLGALVSLEQLALARTALDDEGVAALQPLRALRTLDLEGTRVSAASLPLLAQFTWLTSLDLGGTQLADARLATLAPLGALTTLRLGGSGLPAAEVRALPHVSGLELLDLSALAVGDAEAHWLAAHAPRLQLLKLNFTTLGDVGLAALTGLPELRRLDLGKTRITDAGLRALAGARSLGSLDLGLCAVTNEGVRALSSLPLESLFLAGTPVDDRAVASFPASLRSLGLMKTKLTRAAVPALAQLPLLRAIDLRELSLGEADVAPLVARQVQVRLH